MPATMRRWAQNERPRSHPVSCEQSQRGSNPCLHLEPVARNVQGMTPRPVCPGQTCYTVQTIRSTMPGVNEGMDNFATLDNTSISVLPVLPDILLSSPMSAYRDRGASTPEVQGSALLSLLS